MKKVYSNIGIVTFPLIKAGEVPLSNLINILRPLSNGIYVVTGKDFSKEDRPNEKLHIVGVAHKGGTDALTRIINYTCTQLKISCMLAIRARNVDFYIFFIGGESLLLPMLTAKLLMKKVVLALAGTPVKVAEAVKDTLSKPTGILGEINFLLSNRIIVYSKNIVKERRLEKYRSKISIAHRHFIDFSSFNAKKKIEERENLVGYMGRLSEEKGILCFIEAIPSVLEKRKDITFLIGGDGNLSTKIRKYVNKQNIGDTVEMVGWIPHEELPDYLNDLKLLVLPSYTEGLPNIMLEAMACGSPVLATPVGGVPDVIKDGETGFILEDNSAGCITKNIIRALNHPDLEEVTKNARKLVEKRFSYEATVQRYRKILADIE
jgi:glycosyltransferase involved in cell wall biosynthesis